VNIIFKNHYTPIVKYTVSMTNHDIICCHKKFYGYMFICRNATSVHGKRKVGNLWIRVNMSELSFSSVGQE